MSFVLIALATSALAPNGATIPARFRGEWARTVSDCRVRGGENSAGFTVNAKTIVYYEEIEEVQQVRLTDANTLAYKSKFISADGEEASDGKLRLSPDGRRMLGGTPEEDLLRCPA